MEGLGSPFGPPGGFTFPGGLMSYGPPSQADMENLHSQLEEIIRQGLSQHRSYYDIAIMMDEVVKRSSRQYNQPTLFHGISNSLFQDLLDGKFDYLDPMLTQTPQGTLNPGGIRFNTADQTMANQGGTFASAPFGQGAVWSQQPARAGDEGPIFHTTQVVPRSPTLRDTGNTITDILTQPAPGTVRNVFTNQSSQTFASSPFK